VAVGGLRQALLALIGLNCFNLILMSRKVKVVLNILVLLLAMAGLFFLGGFWALRLGLTKTAGKTDFYDRYFIGFYQNKKTVDGMAKADDLCKLAVISRFQPSVARGLFEIMDQANYGVVLNRAIAAQEIYLTQSEDYRQALSVCRGDWNFSAQNDPADWRALPEWQTLREAIVKDAEVINLAAQKAGGDARLLVSVLTVEQLRLFTSEREVFKQIFQPLKILGTQSKFSWGVMGMKEETAEMVENNLKDKNSPFYLGPQFENLLDFSATEATDKESARFLRLTDQHDHSYAYLYAALFLKQIMAQWEKAGYNIDDRPEILATLFNLGFTKSAPKAEPAAGGAEIEIGGKAYSFGGLAFQFYYSGELANDFPLKIN